MNKIVKRILIGTGVVVLILALVMGGFVLKMKTEMKKMKIMETTEVAPNVFSIKDSFVNMFLLKDSDNYVTIDAGNDVEVIKTELKKLNVNPDKVIAVMLTHTDGDHTAALRLFKNAKIYLSGQEEQMINGTTSKFMGMGNKLYTKDYILFDDQQVITFGNIKIKGILTPGHTPGSMSFLVNNKYLFVGDAFGLKDGKIDKPNEFFSKDMKTAILSFQKINNLPEARYIFTAHTGYSHDYKTAVKTELK